MIRKNESEPSSVNPSVTHHQSLRELVQLFNQLNPEDPTFPQSALAIKKSLLEVERTRTAIKTIKTLLEDPLTRPTNPIRDAKRIISDPNLSGTEKLTKIQALMHEAIHHPVEINVLGFVKFRPTHPDSLSLYEEISRACFASPKANPAKENDND